MSGRSNVREVEQVVDEAVNRVLPGDAGPGFRPAINIAMGPDRSRDTYMSISQNSIGRQKPKLPEHRIPAIASEGGNMKTTMRAPLDPFEDDEDKWASRGSLAIPYVHGATDRIENDDIWAMDPDTPGIHGGGAQPPGEADTSFEKIWREENILRKPRIEGRADPNRGMEKNAFRRMLEGLSKDETAITQTDVDVLIFSASMTKKCFPKCVRGLEGHGALLEASEKTCLRQCANAYFEAEALLAKTLSSTDPTPTFTYKPKV